MVRVKGSRGVVQVDIIGIAEVRRKIEAQTKKILSNTDVALLRGANLFQQEVQESILGNRFEKRSVDSGTLANNIEVNKVKEFIFDIFVNPLKYPGVQTTTVDVGKFLEFGTSKITPRRHFGNTFIRNAEKAEKAILNAIKF